ncbi:MAG: hypothetical protein E6Q97_12480 [Desulfurellales bacterium]|nr:MAG: hypothetical protein E6Q97_12480 [Desulfurellales bacterium]
MRVSFEGIGMDGRPLHAGYSEAGYWSQRAFTHAERASQLPGWLYIIPTVRSDSAAQVYAESNEYPLPLRVMAAGAPTWITH